MNLRLQRRQDRRRQVAELYTEGLTLKEIAAALGAGFSTVRKDSRALGLGATPGEGRIRARGGMVPAGPLLAALRRSERPVCALGDRLERAYYRARASGSVTRATADDLCAALGVHPAGVYGDAWWR